MKAVCAGVGTVVLAALCLFRRLDSSIQEGIIDACITFFLPGVNYGIHRNNLVVFVVLKVFCIKLIMHGVFCVYVGCDCHFNI